MREMRLQYIVTTPAAKRIFFVTSHIFIATLRHYKHANAMYYVSISQPCCQPVFLKKLPGRQFFSFFAGFLSFLLFPPLSSVFSRDAKGLLLFQGQAAAFSFDAIRAGKPPPQALFIRGFWQRSSVRLKFGARWLPPPPGFVQCGCWRFPRQSWCRRPNRRCPGRFPCLP